MRSFRGQFSLARLWVVCAGSALTFAGLVASNISFAQTTHSLEPYRLGYVDASRSEAQTWGVSDEDWLAYQALMTGHAGLHYRHLSPPFVLGLYANNDADRERYARMVYLEERERLNKLFAFNRAYARIAREQNEPLLDPKFLISDEPTDIPQFSRIASTIDRPLVFVKAACPSCDDIVKDLVRRNKSFDIYFVGAKGDMDINRWASSIHLSPQLVSSRQITLNHEMGLLSRSGRSTQDLPVVFSDSGLRTPLTGDQVK